MMKIGYILGFLILVIAAGTTYGYLYTQRFNQNSETTAVQGIIFKTTLHLNEYKNVSSGNDMWGSYARYSRSDRHTEVLTVYCNKYCK